MKKTCIPRRLLSFILVLCMVAPMVMVQANAEENTFNYVSLGASNTNGYGMRGYITEDELNAMLSGQVSKDEVNVYGYQRTPEGAYPDLIRDYYADIYGAENVSVNQLAISSMRVEELRVLLDDSYMGDDYTAWRFTGSDGWFNSAEEGGLPVLRQAYKEYITEADLITVDIGWNNFGVYVCNQLVDYMSNGRYKWTTDINQIFPTDAEDLAAQEAKAIIGGYIKAYVGEGEMTNALTDIFAYSILGYIHNFDIVMEKIYELNPDVHVVVPGIQNLLYGVVVDINGEKMPLGNIFGNFVNMANYYASACSPYQDKYQYVKVGEDEHVTIFLDYMTSYKDGTAKDLDQNVKDCFDYYDNDLFIQTRVDYMAAELVKQMVAEELGEDNLDLALSVLGCKDWMEVVQLGKKGELPTLMGTNYQEVFDAKYWPALYAAYDTLAVLVREIANAEYVDANGLLGGTLDIGAVENSLKKALEAEVQENAIAAASGEEYIVDLDKLLPDAGSKVVAAMYIRYYMGNSFFAHPNGAGHKEIRDAIIGVITNPESETDQVLSEELIASVEKIDQLLHDSTDTTEKEITRLYGSSRVSTAIAVADQLKAVLGCETFDTIIIANGNNFADALTGSYLASVKNAPILLYRGNEVELNEAYIRENLSADGIVYILGGVAAVPAEVEESLTEAGFTVERLYGDTRYATNLKILEAAGIADEEILICTGADYADSLAASATGLPIIMVNSISGKLTDEQIAFFETYADNDFTIIGGNAAVSDELKAEIEAIVGDVNRVKGDSREETAAAIAANYFDGSDCVVIAFSRNFPDGLCGGPLACAMKAPLLLVNANKEGPAANYVAENAIAQGFILGGTAAVSDESVAVIFGN